MTGIIHLMRHGKTEFDQNLPVLDWSLTKEGLHQAEDLASTGIFDSIDRIFSSSEPKALQTARPFA
ncbi:MAG: phosphoglycerate mutase family protein, partial [Candidatus Thorarchaeota archaeon]